MKFKDYISEAMGGWKRTDLKRYSHKHDETRSIIVRRLSDSWEIRFMKELSPGEPLATMQAKQGFKTEKDAMNAANKMMKQKGSWEK